MMARCLSLSLLTRTVAAFGMPGIKRARSTLVVAPADGQTFAVAGDSADKITLLLDDVKAKICVRTQVEGREPSPETCLQNVGSVDLFNVPRGGLRLLVRDADREESLSIAVAKTKEFVPGDEWREVGEKAVPAGLDIRLPLDGAAKVARVPPTWRLQLYVEPPDGRPGFWRANVTRDTPIRALEADLRKWLAGRGASALPSLALGDGRPFHAAATAGLVNLFAHQHDLACTWTRPTAPPAPEAPVVLTRDAPPAKVEAPADEAPDAPVVLTRDAPAKATWAAGGPLRVVRPPAGFTDAAAAIR